MIEKGNTNSADLRNIIGLEHAKRALEICAAGGHRLRITGAQGCGAKALAGCLNSLLPMAGVSDEAKIVDDPDLADMEVVVQVIHLSDLSVVSDSSATVRERVLSARVLQAQRQNCLNAQLRGSKLMRVAAIDQPTAQMLEAATEPMLLSSRDIISAVRVGRTIADLGAAPDIARVHVAEALGYNPKRRFLDRRPP